MKRFFLTVTRGARGWMVQPAERVKVGVWKFGKALAGPFDTKREAEQWKREWRSLPW